MWRSAGLSCRSDAQGNVLGNVTWTYDDLDRPASMTDSSGTMSWTYTHEDQVSIESLTAPAQTTPYAQVSYCYDAPGRRSKISAAGAGTQVVNKEA